MRIITPRGVARTFVVLAVSAGPLLGVIDGGAVGYARLATEDDARTVGHAAVEAVRGEPLTQQTALSAYRAASATAARFGATVDRADFAVHRDGSVTLTLHRTAPTLVFDHLPFLRDTTAITSTVTVEPAPYA
jgi:hypothetical protein